MMTEPSQPFETIESTEAMKTDPPVQTEPAVPYAAPLPAYAPAYAEPKPKKVKTGVPGLTGFGFTAALLSLFLMPFYKEAFDQYLFYEGAKEFLLNYYYYATISIGSVSALLALLGLVLTPIGVHLSRRRQSDGRALGIAGTLIALVALIFIAAVTVSHIMLFGWLFPH